MSLSRRRFLGALVALPLAPTLARLARALPPVEAVAATTTAAAAPAVPPGTVLAYAGDPPAGYLPCDGRYVSPRDYPELYKAIGKSFGVHPTLREFRVPDLRARVGFDVGRADVAPVFFQYVVRAA